MTVGIVVPLKAKGSAKNWATVSASLDNTLRSIEGQACDRYECVVVGHDRPEAVTFDGQRIRFAEYSDAPPPTRDLRDPVEWQRQCDRDKNGKILAGLRQLRHKVITHWFVLDADDWIANTFVATVLDRVTGVGAVIDSGYVYHVPSRKWIQKQRLSESCGSTSVLRNPVGDQANSFFSAANPWFRYGHGAMHSYFRQEEGGDYQVLDEPLVCYVVGHGENASHVHQLHLRDRLKKRLKLWLRGVSDSAECRRLFGQSSS